MSLVSQPSVLRAAPSPHIKEMICVLLCCLICFFLNQLRFGCGLNLCDSGWVCSVLWVKSCGFVSHAWVKCYTLLQLAGGQCALRPAARFHRVAYSLASEPLFLLEYVCVEENGWCEKETPLWFSLLKKITFCYHVQPILTDTSNHWSVLQLQ